MKYKQLSSELLNNKKMTQFKTFVLNESIAYTIKEHEF